MTARSKASAMIKARATSNGHYVNWLTPSRGLANNNWSLVTREDDREGADAFSGPCCDCT